MNGDLMDVDVGTNSCLRPDHSDFFVLFSLSFGDCLNLVADRERSAWAPQLNGADPALQETMRARLYLVELFAGTHSVSKAIKCSPPYVRLADAVRH